MPPSPQVGARRPPTSASAGEGEGREAAMTGQAASCRQGSITVVVDDDHAVLLDGVIRNLDRPSDMTVVASATRIREAVAAVEEHAPDIVVLDYELPDGDGAGAALRIIERRPSVHVRQSRVHAAEPAEPTGAPAEPPWPPAA